MTSPVRTVLAFPNPVNEKAARSVAGMVVLLALMAIITFFDVSRLFEGVRLLP